MFLNSPTFPSSNVPSSTTINDIQSNPNIFDIYNNNNNEDEDEDEDAIPEPLNTTNESHESHESNIPSSPIESNLTTTTTTNDHPYL